MRVADRDDVAALRRAFERQGFVQVPGFLDDDSAMKLHECLVQHVPWGLACIDGEARYLRRRELEALGDEGLAALTQRTRVSATDSYQYLYDSYPILDAYLQHWGEVPLLDRYLEFLNGPEVLATIRAITGLDAIIKADAQATRFRPGQFLRRHTDLSRPGETWLVAYVLNLTPAWQVDWGGYLQFIDDAGDVSRALAPRFNVLNLLRVPQPHNVSMVTPFAGADRYAITGWFRSR